MINKLKAKQQIDKLIEKAKQQTDNVRIIIDYNNDKYQIVIYDDDPDYDKLHVLARGTGESFEIAYHNTELSFKRIQKARWNNIS